MAKLDKNSIATINGYWKKYLSKLEKLDSREKKLVSYFKEGLILRNLGRPNESFTTEYKIIEQFIREAGSDVIDEIKKRVGEQFLDLVKKNTREPVDRRLRNKALDFLGKELLEKGKELSPERSNSDYVTDLVEENLKEIVFAFIKEQGESTSDSRLKEDIKAFFDSQNWKDYLFTNKKVIEYLSRVTNFETYLKKVVRAEDFDKMVSSLNTLPSKRGYLAHPQIGEHDKEITRYDHGICSIFSRHLLLNDLLRDH